MFDEDYIIPRNPKKSLEKLVSGLRNYAPPSECRVYRMNPDGTRGEFLRIEKTEEIQIRFNNGRKRR